jgi:hypothetical protein
MLTLRVFVVLFVLIANGTLFGAAIETPPMAFRTNEVLVGPTAGSNAKKAQLQSTAEIQRKALHRYLVLVSGTGVGAALIGLGFLLQQKYPHARRAPRQQNPPGRSSSISQSRSKRKHAARVKG